MNIENLHTTLIAAAKRVTPSDAVPYAFEKRIMARIADLRPLDIWSAWSAALWRSAFACLVVTMLVGGYRVFAPEPVDTTSAAALSRAFENQFYVGMTQELEDFQ